MDIVQECLSLVPVPGLQAAFSALRFIYQSYTQVQTQKHQLHVLAGGLALLLKTLNGEYKKKRLLEDNTGSALKELTTLLTEVAHLTEKCASEHFLKMMFTKDTREAQISTFHRRIDAAVALFKVTALVDLQHMQTRNEMARSQDQQILTQRLAQIESNQSEMRQILQEMMDQQHTTLALMASLGRRSQTASSKGDREFFTHGAQFLANISGQQVEIESWTITSLDVEFGPEIGSGGFGEVFKGTWGRTEVALKVLKIHNGAAPSSNTVHHEVKLWSTLTHPNILQFLGANVLDGRPFIVMPYIKQGNARDFITRNPECDRLKIIQDISGGLFYLHSRNIVHGDLKATNVLIDDSGKALLCDFGLSRVKADATTRTSKQGGVPASGSRNWMAPELLKGGSQRKACDIYSLGMTIFEIYTNEIPFLNIDFGDFFELVVRNHTRPERPDEREVMGFSDDLWKMTERCWAPAALDRPAISQVCDTITQILRTRGTFGLRVEDSPVAEESKTVATLPRPPRASATRSASAPLPTFIKPVTSGPMDPLPTPYLRLKQVSLVTGHSGDIQTLAFSPDGSQFASGSDDRTVRIWDANSGKELRTLLGHTGRVTSLAYSPDGQRLVSGAWSRPIRVWDPNTGNLIQTLEAPDPAQSGEHCQSVAFSPDGLRIVSCDLLASRLISIWDSGSGNLLYQLKGHTDNLNSVTFSPDGEQIATAASESVRLWDAKTGRQLAMVKGCAHNVAFSPNNQRIAAVSSYYSISIGAAKTREGAQESKRSSTLGRLFPRTPGRDLHRLDVHRLDGHQEAIFCLTFSPDGKWLASASQDKTVRIWDANAGKLLQTLEGHTLTVNAVAFSPDGKRLISGGKDKCIRIWGVPTSQSGVSA